MFCLSDEEISMVDGGGEGNPTGYSPGGSYGHSGHSANSNNSNYPVSNNGGHHSNANVTSPFSTTCVIAVLGAGIATAMSGGSAAAVAAAANAAAGASGCYSSFGSYSTGSGHN